MAVTGHVVFSHGLDGTPFSTKIRALYEIAEAEGYEVAAVDYRGVDDPEQRVQMLHEFCRGFSGHLVLVGSSLGGYVSLAAAPTLHLYPDARHVGLRTAIAGVHGLDAARIICGVGSLQNSASIRLWGSSIGLPGRY